jgi:hypothetical protein
MSEVTTELVGGVARKHGDSSQPLPQRPAARKRTDAVAPWRRTLAHSCTILSLCVSLAAFGTLAYFDLIDYIDYGAPHWTEYAVNAAPMYAFVLAVCGFSGGKPRTGRERGFRALAVLALVLAFFGVPLLRLVGNVIPEKSVALSWF